MRYSSKFCSGNILNLLTVTASSPQIAGHIKVRLATWDNPFGVKHDTMRMLACILRQFFKFWN